MPGFMLGFPGETPLSGSVTAAIKPIYTFAWSVPHLFGEQIPGTSPLIYLKDCTPPQFAFDTEEYESASIKLKYASRISWNDAKLVFYDTVGLLSIIQKWRESVWTREDGMKVASEYKKLSTIFLDTIDGGLANKWDLYGSWPKQVDYSALTYTSSDVHSVDITLAYDWAEISDEFRGMDTPALGTLAESGARFGSI